MKYFPVLLLITVFSSRVFGQQDTKPKECTNPSGGVLIGGAFSVVPLAGCLDNTTDGTTISALGGLSPSGGKFESLGYIFNFKDGDKLVFPPGNVTSATVTKPGTYWIMQGGNDKGVAHITCNSIEVIQTEKPDVSVSLCGDKKVTLTFLNTPKNQKHSKYRILWGNGLDESFDKSTLPFERIHTYSSPPTNRPLIVALYSAKTNSVLTCQSTPLEIAINSKPIINELEGLNGGGSAKLTVSAGLDGQGYAIQKKTDKGVWTNTGKEITRNSGVSITTQTVEGLSKDSLYCFRLRAKDACDNEVLSDEICSIKLNAKIISGRDAELSWNKSSGNAEKYEISYDENPSGENPNRISTVKNAFDIDILECSKKYNFRVTAFIGNNSLTQTRIKSPQILVDPSSIKEYPAPENISVVSVMESNILKYNILELRSKKERYLLFRSTNGGKFEKIAESTENVFKDTSVDLEKNQYCYAYKYEDNCGTQSALSVNKACNIKLNIEGTTLKWTPFFLDNSSMKPVYYIELVNEDGIRIIDASTDTTSDSKLFITPILKNNSNTILKFRIRGEIRTMILISGQSIVFPFDAYSNTVTYDPESETFNIYPNPSDDFVQFDLFFQLKTAEIVDLQGKVIETQSIESGQVSIKTLPKGKYILRLYDQAGKLIINKAIVKI